MRVKIELALDGLNEEWRDQLDHLADVVSDTAAEAVEATGHILAVECCDDVRFKSSPFWQGYDIGQTLFNASQPSSPYEAGNEDSADWAKGLASYLDSRCWGQDTPGHHSLTANRSMCKWCGREVDDQHGSVTLWKK